MAIVIIGRPGDVGGAATKIADLIGLLNKSFEIDILVLEREERSRIANGRHVSRENNVRVIRRDELSKSRHKAGIAVCELGFFESGVPELLKERGIPLVWSNDMMWEFSGEPEAVKNGLINRVVFVSDLQRQYFERLYSDIEHRLIPNYVSPDRFPYLERVNQTFVVGRLSRPDPVKYPIDFPVFYEELDLEDVRFRVQAWSEELRRKYSWHRFGPHWELLPAGKIPAAEFLSSLDLFVYPLGHQFKESWGRSTVEAMLTGCVPVVPAGHNFEKMFVHGESGFICSNFSEFKSIVGELYQNQTLRLKIGKTAASHCRSVLCNREEHRQLWIDAVSF